MVYLEINWRKKLKPLTDASLHIFFLKTPLISYVWILFSCIYSIFCGLDLFRFVLIRVDSCRARVARVGLVLTRAGFVLIRVDSCRTFVDSCWLVLESCWFPSNLCWFVLTRGVLSWYSRIRIDLIDLETDYISCVISPYSSILSSRLPPVKSHNPLLTWSCKITRQTKNISLLP